MAIRIHCEDKMIIVEGIVENATDDRIAKWMSIKSFRWDSVPTKTLMDTMIFHLKMRAIMWARAVYNEIVLTKSS